MHIHLQVANVNVLLEHYHSGQRMYPTCLVVKQPNSSAFKGWVHSGLLFVLEDAAQVAKTSHYDDFDVKRYKNYKISSRFGRSPTDPVAFFQVCVCVCMCMHTYVSISPLSLPN